MRLEQLAAKRSRCAPLDGVCSTIDTHVRYALFRYAQTISPREAMPLVPSGFEGNTYED